MSAPSIHTLNRRNFIRTAAVLAGSAVAARAADEPAQTPRTVQPCLFTKPLGTRGMAGLPEVLHDLGVNAVDLTCRPGGHVLPERVADDLPAAIDLLKAAGITVPMVTTGITTAGKDSAEAIVQAVSRAGIRHIKLGYYPYADMRRILPTLANAKARLRDVAALCRSYHVQAGYHTHSGANVGSGLWDAWQLLDGLPTEDVGCYYDLRHATVEGGDRGWEIGLNLLAPRITMLAIKDFVWAKNEKGQWSPRDVALGAGMCRHAAALRRMKELGFAGPVSLHCEYCVRPVPVGSDEDRQVLQDIRRDWATMKRLLTEAGFAA